LKEQKLKFPALLDYDWRYRFYPFHSNASPLHGWRWSREKPRYFYDDLCHWFSDVYSDYCGM